MANSLNERKFSGLVEDNKTAAENNFSTGHGQVMAGIYNSSLPTLANNDYGFLRLTSDGKLMVDTELTLDGNVIIDNIAVWATNIADSTTTSFALVDASGHPQVDVLTLPGGLTGYTEDDAHTTGDFGLMPLAVRTDTAAALAGTDGDYIPFTTDALGNLRVITTDVSGNAMPSMDANTRPGFFTLTDGTTEVDVIATINSVKADTSSIAGTATNVNGGNRDAGTQTTTLADDDPAVASLGIVDDWDEVHDAACGTDGALMMGIARSSQETAVASDDAVRPVFNVYGEQILAGYDWSAQNIRTAETDPISTHHVEETLAAVTNGADDTYYYYWDMDGFKYFALQATLSGGSGTCTVTVEATIQDDGTAPASCTYVDVTNDLFTVASITASDMLIADTVNPFKYVRTKVVAATGAADDADWTLYLKKLY